MNAVTGGIRVLGLALFCAALGAWGGEAPAAAVPPDDPGATKVLSRWLTALGGVSELKELRTLDAISQIDYGTGPIDVHLRAVARDGRYRYEFNLPKYGLLIQAFNGTLAWQRNDQLGFGPISREDHIVNWLGSDFRGPLHVGGIYPVRRLLPDETIGARKLQVLEMGLRDGNKEKWYFDPATGYRVRVELSYLTPVVTIDFDDFRSAFGASVKEPYHIVRHRGAAKTELRMKVILYNEEMDDALFTPSLPAVQENAEIERALFYNAQFRGGAEAGAVQTRVVEQDVFDQAAGVRSHRKIYQQRPNLLAIESDEPAIGKSWQGFDGEVGWVWNEVEGYRELRGAELQQMLGSTDFDGPLRLAAACPLRRWLGSRQVGERNLFGIALATAAGPAGAFYFDQHTFELVQLETLVQAGAAGQLRVLAEFSDYRRVDGVMVPFSTTLRNAALHITTTTRSIQHNVPLDPALFRPRRE